MDYRVASPPTPASHKRRRISAPASTISRPNGRDPSSSSELSPSTADNGMQKGRKVSRACDFCKSRKAKCSGTQPCDKCVVRGRSCMYDAKYTRGRPPTPPSRMDSDGNTAAFLPRSQPVRVPENDAFIADIEPLQNQESTGPSRESPELGIAEIQGQVFDSTSGLSFLHRAWKRLSTQNANAVTDEPKISAETQPVTMAGDNPLPNIDEQTPLRLPGPAEARYLVGHYFDFCVATYRFLHRPTVEGWLCAVERNVEAEQPIWHGIGRVRAAIVLGVLAVAVAYREKSNNKLNSVEDEARALRLSDEFFCRATKLTDSETGYPRLESAQARLVQVLYLLTTSRFNRSWFVFGGASQFVSALGLHRRVNARRRRTNRAVDYIHMQCGLRTFWTSYVLDNHLGVVFGRPRYFHDDDIDQELPDRVNDDCMTADGPSEVTDVPDDCQIDALIFHVKIARIMGRISREVYSTRDISDQGRVAAVHRLMQMINEWRDSLPLHLGSIPPSMLITRYRRQATVLKLAQSHAIMHANRLFLLGSSTSLYEDRVNDCMAAAKATLETVDAFAKEGPMFHAFWWTHYIVFIALVVVYVWEIQQRRQGHTIGKENRVALLSLAERCHGYLAQATASNSPSRRYAVILEEFREAALTQIQRPQPIAERPEPTRALQPMDLDNSAATTSGAVPAGHIMVPLVQNYPEGDPTVVYHPNLLDEWETTDWLDLDSSAFWPHVDFTESLTWPNLS
ncbi:Activator of stress protein [Paramyrothecium foliicola]|nr:Activator of stress protein [Paramyrothecium foliicola]